MNPNKAFANRTARLVAENKTPAYTTETPKVSERDHLEMVEVVDSGGRYWSGPFTSRQMAGVLAQYEEMGSSISDIDCSSKCWCAK